MRVDAHQGKPRLIDGHARYRVEPGLRGAEIAAAQHFLSPDSRARPGAEIAVSRESGYPAFVVSRRAMSRLTTVTIVATEQKSS